MRYDASSNALIVQVCLNPLMNPLYKDQKAFLWLVTNRRAEILHFSERDMLRHADIARADLRSVRGIT